MTNANNAAAAPMNFDEFAKAYRATFAKMMSYKLTEVGSDIYAEKLANLADAYPEWAEAVEAE
jgi:hypothetical protein